MRLCYCGRCSGRLLHAPDCGHFGPQARCDCGAVRAWLRRLLAEKRDVSLAARRTIGDAANG